MKTIKKLACCTVLIGVALLAACADNDASTGPNSASITPENESSQSDAEIAPGPTSSAAANQPVGTVGVGPDTSSTSGTEWLDTLPKDLAPVDIRQQPTEYGGNAPVESQDICRDVHDFDPAEVSGVTGPPGRWAEDSDGALSWSEYVWFQCRWLLELSRPVSMVTPTETHWNFVATYASEDCRRLREFGIDALAADYNLSPLMREIEPMWGIGASFDFDALPSHVAEAVMLYAELNSVSTDYAMGNLGSSIRESSKAICGETHATLS